MYNIVDHASNWSFKRAYATYNAKNTKDFMERLIAVCPFIIKRLQSDNGVEFTYKYVSVSDDPKEHPLDTFCNKNNIIHKLVPPGEKELQGLVERSHRQDDQELFSRISPHNLEEFIEKLDEFYKQRNKKRRFKKLGWKTPVEWLNQYVINALVIKLIDLQQKGHRPFARELSENKNNFKNLNFLEDKTEQNLSKETDQKDVKHGKLAA